MSFFRISTGLFFFLILNASCVKKGSSDKVEIEPKKEEAPSFALSCDQTVRQHVLLLVDEVKAWQKKASLQKQGTEAQAYLKLSEFITSAKIESVSQFVKETNLSELQNAIKESGMAPKEEVDALFAEKPAKSAGLQLADADDDQLVRIWRSYNKERSKTSGIATLATGGALVLLAGYNVASDIRQNREALKSLDTIKNNKDSIINELQARKDVLNARSADDFHSDFNTRQITVIDNNIQLLNTNKYSDLMGMTGVPKLDDAVSSYTFKKPSWAGSIGFGVVGILAIAIGAGVTAYGYSLSQETTEENNLSNAGYHFIQAALTQESCR